MLLVAPGSCEVLLGRSSLRLGERFARPQEALDVDLTLARELVDEPDRDGRLAQPFHLIGEVALALASEPLRDLVARGGELVQRQRVEVVELLLEAHAASLVSF